MAEISWKASSSSDRARAPPLGCSAELNYENLCDNDYLMRILASQGGVSESFSADSNASGSWNGSSSSPADASNDLLEHYVRRLFGSRVYTDSYRQILNSGHEHSDNQALVTRKRTRGGLKKISLADGDMDWVTSGNMPEEIVMFGNELHLGRQAINERFNGEIYSLVRTQDALSSLVYKQIIAFDKIGAAVADKMSKARCLPSPVLHARENGARRRPQLVEDALTCSLRILEQQSRRGSQDLGSLEPLVSLVLRMLSEEQSVEDRERALESGKGKGVATVQALSRGSRAHFHYLRSMLCNALSDLHKYSPRLEGNYSNRERVYKLKVCLCCAHGLLCIGLLAKDMGDVLVAVSNLLALQAMQDEWKDESALLAIAEEGDASLVVSGASTGNKRVAADRPLSGRKMELIEKSMSKRAGAAGVGSEANPASASTTSAIKGPGGSAKLLKIDTNASSDLDLDPQVSHKVENGTMFEKSDERTSPLSNYPEKRSFFPAGGNQIPHNGSNPQLIIGNVSHSGPLKGAMTRPELREGAAKVVLDKDAKMRVQRVHSGHAQMPGRSMASGLSGQGTSPSSLVGGVEGSPESSKKTLAQSLRSLNKMPKAVLRVMRESSKALNKSSYQWHHSKPQGESKSSRGPVHGGDKQRHYVWSAGQNSYGELGLGDTSQRRAFSELPGHLYQHHRMMSIGAGNEHSVFVTEEGKVFVVGYNENGQCGLGNTQQVRGPQQIHGLGEEVVAQVHVYNGCEHTLAVSKEGKLYAFGYNYRGQLGIGTTSSETSPCPIRSLANKRVVSAASSYHHSFFLCDDNSLFSVGRNDCGQLGHGDGHDKKTPAEVKLPVGEEVRTMSCGQFHTIVGCAAGSAYSCGKNDYGQVGLESAENTRILTKLPTFVEGAMVQQVVCGYYHTLVLLQTGVLAGFGRNDYGQLGLGHTQPRVKGYHVISALRDKNISSVSAGCYHSIAVATNSMIYVFGRNNHGQLGTGDLVERHLPHPVDCFLGKKVLQVAAGFYHSLVLTADQASVYEPVSEEKDGISSYGLGVSVPTRVRKAHSGDDLQFDEFFSNAMHARMAQKSSREVNQQQGYSLEVVNASAVTAALQELSLPLSAYNISGQGNRSKLPLKSLLPFLVDLTASAVREKSRAQQDTESISEIPTDFTEASTSRDYSWLSRQLRAIAVLLTTTRQVATSASLFVEAPMQVPEALRLMRTLVEAAEVIFGEHGSALVQHTALYAEGCGESSETSTLSSVSMSRAASLELTDLVSNMDSQRLMLAEEMLSSVHEESAAFFQACEEHELSSQKDKEPPCPAGLLSQAMSHLRQELLLAYYALPEAAEATDNTCKEVVVDLLKCFSRHYSVLFAPASVKARLFSQIESHLISAPALEQLLNSLSASAQMHSMEADTDLLEYRKHLRLFRCISAKYTDFTYALDLFQSSVGESLQIYDHLLQVYTRLSSVSADIRDANISGGVTLRHEQSALHQECLRATRAIECCFSNFTKCACTAVFAKGCSEAALVHGLSIINDTLFSAGEAVREKIEKKRAEGDGGAGLSSSLRHGALLSVVVPTILSFAINCEDRRCVRTILPAVRSLISRLHELGVVEIERASSSSNKSITVKDTDTKKDGSLQSSWWSRLLKLAIILYTQESCVFATERSVPHDPSLALLEKNLLWRYLAFPEETTTLALGPGSVTARIDDSLISICNELRQREMITNHTYRLLYQQSSRKSVNGGKKVSEPGSVKRTVERIEILLLSMMVHVDGPGLLDFWPLSQVRSSKQMEGSRLAGKQGNKRLYRIWAIIAGFTKHVFSQRSKLCARGEGGSSWSQILEGILLCVARCHSFFLAAKPLVQYQLSPLPCEECTLDALKSPRSSQAGRAKAAFRRCVNCVICLVRWKAVTRARLGGVGSAVSTFVKDVLSLSADAIVSSSTTGKDSQESVWTRLLASLGQGTSATNHFSAGLTEVNALLEEVGFHSLRADIMVIVSVSLRSVDVDFLDTNLPYDALPGLALSASAFARKREALRGLENFLAKTMLGFHSTYCGAATAATGATSTTARPGLNEVSEIMVATKLLHFLCTTTRTCVRILPAQIRPDVLADVLLCLVGEESGEGTEGKGAMSLDEKLPALNGLPGDKSGSSAVSAGKKSTQTKERSRSVRKACVAIMSLFQDLAATINPTIHPDSQRLGSELVRCFQALISYFHAVRVGTSRTEEDPLSAHHKGDGGQKASKDSLANKRRCQELIRSPVEFCRSQEGFVVQGDKLLNNYKGMDFTLAMWIMPTSKFIPRHCFVTGKISHNDAWPLISLRNDGKLVVIYGHGNEFERITSQTTVPLCAWTHVTVVVEPKKIKLFVNGVVDSQVSTKGNGRAILYPVVVGSCPAGLRTRVDHIREGFDGMLAQYKYYTRALSPIHVRVVFDQGPPEAFDVQERWLFQLLTSSRLLLDSCGGLIHGTFLEGLASAAMTVYVCDESAKLRSSALIVLRDILLRDSVSSVSLPSRNFLDESGEGTTSDQPRTGTDSTDAWNKAVPRNVTDFRERIVYYFVRTLGACCMPLSVRPTACCEDKAEEKEESKVPAVSPLAVPTLVAQALGGVGGSSFTAVANDEPADDELNQIAETEQAAPTGEGNDKDAGGAVSNDDEPVVDEESGSNWAIDAFLQYAPALISSQAPRPSSSMIGAGAARAESDKGSACHEERNEVSALVCSLLCELSAEPAWQSAITRVVTHVSDSYCANSPCDEGAEGSHQPQNMQPQSLVDVLGVALFLSGPDLGVHVGSLVENYHSNSPCRVLSLNKTSGYATLIGWNSNTRMFQVTHVQLKGAVTKTRAVSVPSGLRTRIAMPIASLLERLQSYLPLLLSDLLCIRNEDHPFLYQVLLRATRPLEILCFALLLEGLSREPGALAGPYWRDGEKAKLNVSDNKDYMSVFKERDLISTLKEAAMRTQISPRIASSSVQEGQPESLSALLVAATPFLTSLPDSVVTRTSFPPSTATSAAMTEGEAEHLLSDYIGKVLGLAVETFQGYGCEAANDTPGGRSPSEELLRQGKLFELIQNVAIASSQGTPLTLSATGGANDRHASSMGGIEMLYSTILDPRAQSEGHISQNLNHLDLHYITSHWDVATVGSRSSPFTLNSGLGTGTESEIATLSLLLKLRDDIITHSRTIENYFVHSPRQSVPSSKEGDGVWRVCLWEMLMTVPSGGTSSDYKAKLADMVLPLPLAYRLEFTQALASSLRYAAGSLFHLHHHKTCSLSGEGTNLLACTDLLLKLVHAVSMWMELHMDFDPVVETEVDATFLRLLLPALYFVENEVVEEQLLHLCRVCLETLIAHTLHGRKPTIRVLELANGSSFTLLRARAQEHLTRINGEQRYSLPRAVDSLTQLAVGLEILQKSIARVGVSDHTTAVSRSPTPSVGSPVVGHKSPLSSPAISPSPISKQSMVVPPLSNEVLQASTGPPTVVGVQGNSVDIDLKDCLRLAEPPLMLLADTSSSDELSLHLVEVALGVVVEGEEIIFETVYCGNSYRFVESALAADCAYALRCRVIPALEAVDEVEYGWSEEVHFRTEPGVPFTFDTNRRGQDILISDDCLTASYAGDDCWSTVLGNRSFSTGITTWEINVVQSSTAYVFVGVASSEAELNSFLGGCRHGWGFIGEQSLYHNREKVKVYGEPFGAGDVVGVVLDLENGLLSFSRNGALLGTAFSNVYGELYPAVAFYNMGQELEIVRESFHTTAPREPIPCSPHRFNMHDLAVSSEIMLCMEHRAAFSHRMHLLLANECNTWCSGLQRLHKTTSGRYLFIDQKSPLLERFGLVVGERVRTPMGVAEVAGTALNRIWFCMAPPELSESGGTATPSQAEKRVWFYSITQVVFGRSKGMFQRCTYEPEITQSMNGTSGNVIAVALDTPRAGETPGASPASFVSISAPGSPLRVMNNTVDGTSTPASSVPTSPFTSPASGASPGQRMIINKHERSTGRGSPRRKLTPGTTSISEDTTAFDAATIGDLISNVYWTETMDAALVDYLQALATTNKCSVWDIDPSDVQYEFRTLQQTLSRIVMQSSDERVSNKWGFKGPKRRAVVARMACLRTLNFLLAHNLVVLVPSLDLRTEELVQNSKFADAADPQTVSVCPPGASAENRPEGEQGGDLFARRVPSRQPCYGVGAPRWPFITLGLDDTPSLSTSQGKKGWRGSPLSRGRVLWDLKQSYFVECIAKSAARPSKTEDDYDYPEDLPQVRINRIRSFRAREAADLRGVPGDDIVTSSMFYQLWKELRKQTCEKFRITYTHPMDDGQCRAFKIRFDGEGVDDYGGPYREIFQQMCDELQASDPSTSKAREVDKGSGANSALNNRVTARALNVEGSVNLDDSMESIGSLGTLGPDGDEDGLPLRHPDRCLLPLLMPTPNWTASECQERYKYTFNLSSRSDLHMDLFTFMGRMVGVAMRSRISVDLALPSAVWKSVVRQPLSEEDLASFDVHAYYFVRHLSGIYKRIKTAGSASEASSAADEASAILQDLTWSAVLSDGSVVDLRENGRQQPVEVGALGEYLGKYVKARLQENAEAVEAFRDGLVSVVPENAITILQWEELQSMVCGANIIDIDRLRRNTEYDEDVSPQDTHIQMFWKVLRGFTEEEKSAFLRFVWARPTLPPKGVVFPQKFKIQGCTGDDSKVKAESLLPRAHTCFFSINLPKYGDEETMAAKLRYAIFNCTEMDADFRLTDASVAGWAGEDGERPPPSSVEER